MGHPVCSQNPEVVVFQKSSDIQLDTTGERAFSMKGFITIVYYIWDEEEEYIFVYL